MSERLWRAVSGRGRDHPRIDAWVGRAATVYDDQGLALYDTWVRDAFIGRDGVEYISVQGLDGQATAAPDQCVVWFWEEDFYGQFSQRRNDAADTTE